MSWTERQRAMLEAMGLKLWAPAAGDSAVPAAPVAQTSTHMPTHTPTQATPPMPVRAPVAAPAVARAAVREAPDADVAVAEPPAPRRVAEVLSKALPPTDAPAGGAQVAASGDASYARRLSTDAIAALDWTGLRDEVAQCRACGLCESRKNTVFGVGNERAHWMIVGEAPGEQEDLQGEPFVGAAGKLLDSMLRAIGQGRGEGTPDRQVYIANTLKCRPPRNRNPEPAELAQCEPYLQRQIALIQPRIILAMGRFAVQQLLRSQEPIGRLRGRVHRYEGVPLVVTYHPAYLLRNLADKSKAWEDLCLAMKTADEQDGKAG